MIACADQLDAALKPSGGCARQLDLRHLILFTETELPETSCQDAAVNTRVLSVLKAGLKTKTSNTCPSVWKVQIVISLFTSVSFEHKNPDRDKHPHYKQHVSRVKLLCEQAQPCREAGSSAGFSRF